MGEKGQGKGRPNTKIDSEERFDLDDDSADTNEDSAFEEWNAELPASSPLVRPNPLRRSAKKPKYDEESDLEDTPRQGLQDSPRRSKKAKGTPSKATTNAYSPDSRYTPYPFQNAANHLLTRDLGARVPMLGGNNVEGGLQPMGLPLHEYFGGYKQSLSRPSERDLNSTHSPANFTSPAYQFSETASTMSSSENHYRIAQNVNYGDNNAGAIIWHENQQSGFAQGTPP